MTQHDPKTKGLHALRLLNRPLIWLPVIVYLGVVLMLASLQRSLIYHPHRVTPVPLDIAGLTPQRLHNLTVSAEDGLTLNGWFVPANGGFCLNDADFTNHLKQGRPVAIIFCGNAGHRGYRGDLLKLFTHLGVDAFIFDYRGYGDNAGEPSELAIRDDARAIWRHLTDRCRIKAERIVIFGESLGGGVATQLAAAVCGAGQNPRALIIQASFSSLVETAGHHYPWLPVSWVLQDRFESNSVISKVRCPYLHLHGSNDRIVPFQLGRRLFEAAPKQSASGISKQFVELSGIGHNDIDRTRGSLYGRSVRDFLGQIP